ncbi:hypothetical protein NL676_039052 [Syzygium grande]|nr:hypothetical protein NL676_039052 [Syzygium grande]
MKATKMRARRRSSKSAIVGAASRLELKKQMKTMEKASEAIQPDRAGSGGAATSSPSVPLKLNHAAATGVGADSKKGESRPQ